MYTRTMQVITHSILSLRLRAVERSDLAGVPGHTTSERKLFSRSKRQVETFQYVVR
jgi:hypothetical protein